MTLSQWLPHGLSGWEERIIHSNDIDRSLGPSNPTVVSNRDQLIRVFQT